ncbi:MAG: cytochrome b/b6 domain-containing protein [Chitinivorax sp.]
MQVFNRFRLLHWLLAGFCLAAYLTGEDAGLAHVWLGYGLILAISLRLLLALFRAKGFAALLPKQFSLATPAQSQALLSRLLVLALLLNMLGASVTGVLMVDNSKSLNLAGVSPLQTLVTTARADDDDEDEEGGLRAAGSGEWLEEVHEVFANGTLLVAGLHVAYVWMFRRRLAWRLLGRDSGSGDTAGSAVGEVGR